MLENGLLPCLVICELSFPWMTIIDDGTEEISISYSRSSRRVQDLLSFSEEKQNSVIRIIRHIVNTTILCIHLHFPSPKKSALESVTSSPELTIPTAIQTLLEQDHNRFRWSREWLAASSDGKYRYIGN